MSGLTARVDHCAIEAIAEIVVDSASGGVTLALSFAESSDLMYTILERHRLFFSRGKGGGGCLRDAF